MTFENTLSEIRKYLSENLSEKRYLHTLGVERTMVLLGKYFPSYSEFSLRAAALLHDITKEIPFEEQVMYVKTHGISPTYDDIKSEKTFHELSGAVFAKEKFGDAADSEILSAISKHSTGDENMSLFDMLLYVSDYIEDTRTYPVCICARKKLFEEMEKSSAEEYSSILIKNTLEIVDATIVHLIEKHSFIHRNTLMAHNSLSEKIRES